MRWTDLHQVLALEADVFADQAPWTAETWWEELAGVPERRTYLVAEQRGAVVGYAGIAWTAPSADIMTVAVAPGSRRHGHGRALLQELLADARRRDVTEVFLDVRADNQAGLALYGGDGFERVSRRRDYYGPGVDGLVLRRRLLRPTGPTEWFSP